jgi:hypothetical protein
MPRARIKIWWLMALIAAVGHMLAIALGVSRHDRYALILVMLLLGSSPFAAIIGVAVWVAKMREDNDLQRWYQRFRKEERD